MNTSASTVSLSAVQFSSSEHERANLLLRRRVDEDVERRQLTVLRYTNVSASKPLRVIGRSIRPRKATDAMYRLSWAMDRERIAFNCVKRSSTTALIFSTLS